MVPEVQKGLLDIATDFVSELERENKLKIKLVDVVIIGSVANYNWTQYSDIDLHIITDYDKLDIPKEEAQVMFDAIKANWNHHHNITIKGHDIEMYVQDKSYEPSSAAEYSVLNNKWLKEPVREHPQFDKALIKTKYAEYKKKIASLVGKEDEDGLRTLLEKLYKFRQTGLDAGGELSEENIVFKALRAAGELEKIKDHVTQIYDKKMTVNEDEQTDQPLLPWEKARIERMKNPVKEYPYGSACPVCESPTTGTVRSPAPDADCWCDHGHHYPRNKAIQVKKT